MRGISDQDVDGMDPEAQVEWLTWQFHASRAVLDARRDYQARWLRDGHAEYHGPSFEVMQELQREHLRWRYDLDEAERECHDRLLRDGWELSAADLIASAKALA